MSEHAYTKPNGKDQRKLDGGFQCLTSLSSFKISPVRLPCAEHADFAPETFDFPQISTILSNRTTLANPFPLPTCAPLCQPSHAHSNHQQVILGKVITIVLT